MSNKRTTVWMEVTMDEYELPIRIADTARELAKMCGVRSDYIQFVAMSKDKNKKRRFHAVILDDID